MWTFIKSYWKQIILALFIIAAVCGLYFEGKSAGHDAGYLEGYETAKQQFESKANAAQAEADAVTKAYNDFILQNNQKVAELEKKSAQLSNEKRDLLKKYDEAVKQLKMSEENASKPAWTLETVELINELLP